MRYIFVFSFYLLFLCKGFCQELNPKDTNLIRNSSFEQFDMPIPCNIAVIENHIWDWFAGYQDTPDVLHIGSLKTCSSDNLFKKRLLQIQPYSGNVAIGLRYDISNVRNLYAGEYIYSKMKHPLVINSWYRFKLKVANYTNCTPNSLTVCFSDSKPNSERNLKLGKQHTFEHSDTVANKWKDFEIIFQATEKYQFMAIGGINIDNYNKDSTLCSSYVIDDVFLERIETKEISFDIHFDVAKSSISSNETQKLEELYESVKEAKYIEINAHTDSTGNKIDNKLLSLQRAKTIAAFLIKKGVEENKIISIGYGSEKPIASNATLEGQALNRRVEIKIIQ